VSVLNHLFGEQTVQMFHLKFHVQDAAEKPDGFQNEVTK